MKLYNGTEVHGYVVYVNDTIFIFDSWDATCNFVEETQNFSEENTNSIRVYECSLTINDLQDVSFRLI